MDMELKKKNIEYYDTVLDTSAMQEETLEMIVPDASPDMVRIVSSTGNAFVKDKTLREGALDVNGVIKGGVLYIAEGDKVMRRLEVNMPFKHIFENMAIKPSAKAVVTASLQSMEAREINPRKIAVRANVCIHAKVYDKAELEMCYDLDGADEYAIQMKKRPVSMYAPVVVKEKSFTINDDVEIPQSNPQFASMLRHDVNLVTSDMKIIGNKAIMKGVANIKCAYNTRDGGVAMCEHELPYSQIIDIEGMEDECDLTVKCCMRAAELEPQHDMTGETHYIAVNILVDACAIAYLKGELETIEDLYSTAYNVSSQFDNKDCRRFVDRISRRIAMNETIETANAVKNVIDLSIQLEPAVRRLDNGIEMMANEANLNVMYLGDDDSVYCVSRRCTVTCPLNTSGDYDYMCDALVQGGNCTSMGNELMVRFFVDYDIMQTQNDRVRCISGINVDTDTVRQTGDFPSVIIKYVYATQPIWNIAKQYNTTTDEILAANGLDDIDMIEAGSMLLIPRKR